MNGFAEQQPGHHRGARRHQVEQAGHRGRRAALDQQVQQRAAAQRQHAAPTRPSRRPRSGASRIGSVSSSASGRRDRRAPRRSCTALAVRTSQGATKRFWYSVPMVMRQQRDRAPAPGSPASPRRRACGQTTSAGRRGRAPGRAHWRADTADAPLARARDSQSAVSTGCRPTSSATVPAPMPGLHRRPDAAEVAGVHQHAGDREVAATARGRAARRRAPSAIQTPKQTTDSAIAHGQEARTAAHAACRSARRRSRCSRSARRPRASRAASAAARAPCHGHLRAGADLRQGLLQVVDHRPDRQHRGDPDQHRAPEAGVDQAEQRAVDRAGTGSRSSARWS